jgi:rhamnose transport system ATP-binding protein
MSTMFCRGADQGEAMTVLLRATKICKSFASIHALQDVSFDLRGGEAHALIGENGAGKSTFIKIITGAHDADSGTLEINGRIVKQNSPVLSWKLGIAAIYQQPALFPDLTVAENIALGLEPRGAWRPIRWGERRRRARDLLARIGAHIDPNIVVADLTMPEQQLVEIARTLGADARILIMDEPTASLSEREVERLQRVIHDLCNEGVGIIYISHRLEELARIANRVTVLRDGCVIGTRPMAEVSRDEMIRMMVGREITAVFSKQQVPLGDVVLELRRVACRETGVRDVSFQVRAGEILGLAGLVGAGRTELARVLFGLTPADNGEIFLRGRRVAIRSPAGAVKLGIAYVPEDRRRHGVILEMPVAANTSLAILKHISTLGWLDFSRERAVGEMFVKRLGIKTTTLDAAVGELSGGNQQKVAVARWLATEPAVLILDEPTQGVDVGAKAEIHRLMSELAARGLAIVMISSELPEILGMSDRIAVMHAGSVVAELERSEATQEKILALALGHVESPRASGSLPPSSHGTGVWASIREFWERRY